MYLLDTNHCSRILNNDADIVKKLFELGDVLVATCVIVCGELKYMAYNSSQKEKNIENINNFLNDIRIYYIDNRAADLYGYLKAAIFKKFGPKQKSKRSRTKIKDLGFTDNDLWIASIAISQGLILVSSDRDFIRLRQLIDFQLETWWHPGSMH